MTDQKHTKEPSVLKQIINTLMDYINKIECQRDELREVVQNFISLMTVNDDKFITKEKLKKLLVQAFEALEKTKESI